MIRKKWISILRTRSRSNKTEWDNHSSKTHHALRSGYSAKQFRKDRRRRAGRTFRKKRFDLSTPLQRQKSFLPAQCASIAV